VLHKDPARRAGLVLVHEILFHGRSKPSISTRAPPFSSPIHDRRWAQNSQMGVSRSAMTTRQLPPHSRAINSATRRAAASTSPKPFYGEKGEEVVEVDTAHSKAQLVGPIGL
jgi:hypothetical protein